jgi:ribosomal protein S18 acetylase RimI-like enzyme
MEVIDGQKVQVDIIGEIQGILANIVPPTESEVKENRCNYELELEDSSNDGMIDSKENTPQKLFPMFEHPGKKSLASKENTPTKSSIKLKTNNNKVMDDSQMIIDAGQKNIGVETCVVCNFIYNPRNAQDERAHKAIHSTVMGVIKFNGWKNEHNLGEFHDGRIIVIKPNDPKVHWDKAESVLEIIDKQLGCIGYAGQIAIRNRKETKVYFFISANRIVGFLLAEEIGKHDLLSLAAPNPKDEAHKEWLLHDLDLKIYSKVVAGISRIWVSRDFRRLNIATRLVQAMEVSFIEKKFLKKGEEYAFSHTTPDGSLFASKYTSPKNGVFLAYAPILAGFPVQI